MSRTRNHVEMVGKTIACTTIHPLCRTSLAPALLFKRLLTSRCNACDPYAKNARAIWIANGSHWGKGDDTCGEFATRFWTTSNPSAVHSINRNQALINFDRPRAEINQLSQVTKARAGSANHTPAPSRIAAGHVVSGGSLGNLKNATLRACGCTIHSSLGSHAFL